MATNDTEIDAAFDAAEEDEVDETTEVDTDTEEEFTPPTKDEFEAMKRSNARLLAESKRNKAAAKTAREALGNKEAETVDTTASDARFIRSEARAALLAAGATPEKVARLVKLIDTGSLTIEDDDTVDGLLDEVDAVKADFPELFEAPKPVRTRRVPGPADQGSRGTGGPSTLSAAERAIELGYQQAGIRRR